MRGTVNTSESPKTGPVIAGVDGSANAAAAVLWAAAEAERRGQPLHIVHAAGTDNRAAYASVESIRLVLQHGRELLNATAARFAERFPGLLVTTELSHREPAETLHTVAGNHGTIVVGSRGLGGFGSLTHGSVGLGTAAGANGPVVVVRGVEDADSTGTVLVGVRDEEDLDVVRHAAQSAQLRKASLRLLNIWNMFQHVGVVATMLDDVGEIAQERKDKISAVAARIRDNFPEPR